MRKCLYIDHEYHKKTKSTNFLSSLLEKDYELTYCYMQGHKEKSLCSETPIASHYDLVVCFQLLPVREAFHGINFDHGVIVPMYDGMLPLTDPLWGMYRDFRILNFSKTLHAIFHRNGYDSYYIQYYPEPAVADSLGDETSAFFWQRVETLPAKKIISLIDGTLIKRLHIHLASDPGNKFNTCRKYRGVEISNSTWFSSKAKLREQIEKSAFYFAPRIYEGIGQSFLDAMAMGRCVIAVNNPTANEYIKSGYNGILYNYSDNVLEHLEKVRDIQKNALLSVEQGFELWQKNKIGLLKWMKQTLKIRPLVVFDSTILLNLNRPGTSRTGIFFVALNLAKALSTQEDITLAFYVNSSSFSEMTEVLSDIFGENHGFRIYTELSNFGDCSTFLSPAFVIPKFIRENKSIKKSYILHDCIPLIFAGDYGARQQWWFDLFNDISDKDLCFANSNSTKSDFCRYKQELHEDQVDVIPLGVSETFQVIQDAEVIKDIRDKYGITTNRYVLSLCSLEPRKNVRTAIESFITFVRRNNIEDLSFVLVGQKWSEFDLHLDQLNLTAVEASKLVFTGYSPDEDLSALYSGADFFVYTSLYEGFGMPILEAMTCGTPVITSNLSSMPEIAGDAALLVDPGSVEEHVNAIYKLYYSPEQKEKLVKLGFEQLKKYSWEECAKMIVNRIVESENMCFPKITVVTPVFNLVKAGRLEAFTRCVDSVCHQSYPGVVEHIVVDGGSADGTKKILDQLLREGKISKFISEPDNGVYDAMNKGIALATGEYVTFLNSDDYYHDKLGLFYTLRSLLVTGSDYAYGDALVEDINTGLQSVWSGNLENIPFASHYCHQTMFVKRSVLNELNGFDTSYPVSSDSDLCIRIEKKGYSSVHVGYRFVTYFIGEGISSVNQSQAKKDHSLSFFNHYGRDWGLTLDDCNLLWQAQGIPNLSREDKIRIGSSLGRPDWIGKFFSLVLPVDVTASSNMSWQKTFLLKNKNLIRHFAIRYLPLSVYEKGKKIYNKLVS